MGFGSFITNAVKAAGTITKPIARTVEKAVKTVQHVPIVGQVFNVATGIHFYEGAAAVLSGERIDKAVIGNFKKQINDYRTLAPYAASVVAFVPGVGQGIGSGIAAAAALSEGRPLTEVAVEAIKGAVPGGAIAQAAFSVAQAAIQKKQIDDIAIEALPISSQAKQGVRTALALTKDLASGKRVDKALIARIDDGLKLAGPQLQKALNIGLTVGLAQDIQKKIGTQISTPQAKAAFAGIGKAVSRADKILSAGKAISKNPEFGKGFDLATGILNGKNVNQTMLVATRKSLTPEQKKGFDTASAAHIGRFGIIRLGKKPSVKPKTPAEAFGYLTTKGLVGADTKQKTTIVGELAKYQESREGAKNAIKDVASERMSGREKSWWDIIKSVFGF